MNKQIEEIYRILLNGCNGIECFECEGNGKKDGCLHYHNANAIYNAGYRRQDEVAREIFKRVKNAWAEARTESEFLEMLKNLQEEYENEQAD